MSPQPSTSTDIRHMPNLKCPACAAEGMSLVQVRSADSRPKEQADDGCGIFTSTGSIFAHQGHDHISFKDDGYVCCSREFVNQRTAIQFWDVGSKKHVLCRFVQEARDCGYDHLRSQLCLIRSGGD